MRFSTTFRSGAAALLILGTSPTWAQVVGHPGSFPLHEENGAATLIERTGVGSPTARMVGEFTKADIKEMCERIGWKFYSPSFPFHGTLQDRQTITICRAKEEARPREERLYEVRANCPDGLLWNDMGYTFRRVGSEWQTLTGRPVSTEFSAGHLRVLSRQFDLLCSGSPVVAEAPAGAYERAAFVPETTGAIGSRAAPGPETTAGVGGIGGRSQIAEARARSMGF